MQIVVVFLAVLAVVIAAPSYDYKPSYPTYSSYKDNYDYAPAYYDFGYAVKDDYSYVDFGHSENRNGDNTKGQYYVSLPDGRRQVVNYYVDGYSGYVADVKYEGDYKPTYSSNYKPAYKPAYQPEYKPAYQPEYKPAYKPSYKPAYYSPVYSPSYKTEYY